MTIARTDRPFLWHILPLLLCATARLGAQEGAGQAETGFQQYYLAIDSHSVANISGLSLNFSQFIPDVGLISGSLLPATSKGTFRNGDSYLRLKGLPWKRQHWTFTAGDFRVPGQLLPVPFTNITNPEIAARGGSLEASHGNRTVGFFFGEGTVSNTPRVVLRQQVPQKLLGVYWKQAIGARLQLGARFIHFSNDLEALRRFPSFVTRTPSASASTLSLNSLYSIAGPLKLYADVTWSAASQESPNTATRSVPFSVFAGPVFETKMLTLRASYTFQNSSYFPVLGYYIGDRAGPFGEVKYRPFERLEIYTSAALYDNNIARDPTVADFHNSSESAGVSLQLPGRLSVNAQYNKIDLSTRANAGAPWLKSADTQKSISLSRPIAGHNIRVSVRDFQDVSPTNSQRQRSNEIEDNFHLRRLTLGAASGCRL